MLLFLMACGFETSLKANVPDPDVPRDTALRDSAPPVETDTGDNDTGADGDTAQDDESRPPDTGTHDTGTPDSGTPPDTGTPDTGTPDTGTPDTGTPDTGTPDPTEDPCTDAPDVDCPVDVPDTAPCTTGVAAWLPSGRAFTDVQTAIDAARVGDTVAICPGTWTGSLVVATDDLALRGYGAGTTTLDAAGAGVTLTVLAPGATVANLTVTGGTSTGSGGGISAAWSELRLCTVTVTGNRAGSGGGVYVGAGTLEVEDSTFEANTADYQGGAIDSGRAALTMVGGRVTANDAGYAGGGIFGALEGSLAVYASLFDANHTGYEGGAVAVNGSTGADGACFVDTTFSANESDYAGGALSSNGWGAMTFGYEGCAFDGNYAAFGGGAITYQNWGSDTSVTVDSTFTRNESGDHGGAVDMSGGWDILDASFYGTTFDGNTAPLAGAIQAGGVGTERVLLVDSAVTDNAARWAGGIYIDTSSAIEARNTDFGSGATDNAPDDINGSPTWGAGATFTCAGGVCR